jgi:rubrerythrin
MNSKDTEQMKEWVGKITRSPHHTLFFKRLVDKNKYHSDLFMLHKDTISPRPFPSSNIPNVFNPHLTYLVWGTYLYDEEEIKDENDNIIEPIGMELQQEENQMGIELFQESFDNIAQEFKYLIAWIAIETIRNNDSLKRCVESKDFDYYTLLRETQGLQNINLEEIKNKFNSIENEDEMALLKPKKTDSDIERAMKKVFVTVSEGFSKDPLQLIKAMDIGNIWNFIGFIGKDYTNKLLNYSNLTPELYAEIIDEMHYLDLVKSYQTVYICDECDVDNPIVLKTGYNLRIQQANDISCPRCGDPMQFFSIFKIDPFLSKIILSRDGLLSVFAAWIFHINRIPWEFSTYPKKTECDFNLNVNNIPIIIEVKMLYRPNVKSGGWKSFESDIIGGLEQLKNKLDEIKDDKNNPQGILLINLKRNDFEKDPEGIVQTYLSSLKSSPEYNIIICGYDELLNYARNLNKLLSNGENK